MKARRSALIALALVALALLVVGAVYVLWPRPAPPAQALEQPIAQGVQPAQQAPAAPVVPASGPASSAEPVAPLADTESAVQDALVTLLGRDMVLRRLQTDRFAWRVAATIDNLAREHAAPRLWPVNPTEGRFSVDAQNHIAAANAERYLPFVQMVEHTDPAAAAAMYRRLLPQLQAAYESLGYPGRSFHARLMEVIEHLLATPALAQPAPLTLIDVKGSVPSERPWVRYEYADPQLESLSSGRKILLRLNPAQRHQMMVWLRRFRDQVR